jgi:hypothetical protein
VARQDRLTRRTRLVAWKETRLLTTTTNHPRSQHAPPVPARRCDAGAVRFTARDAAGLVLAGDMYGAPYDLLAAALGVSTDRVRAIMCRWRRAGLAETGVIGPGPAWCWLTTAGMRAAGLRFVARQPPLARLAHIRAVLATRIALEAGEEFAAGSAWWRSERRIRAAAGLTRDHVPDAEVHWPDEPASPYPGETWAIEAELTPKGTARTTAIMTGLLTRPAAGRGQGGAKPLYDYVVYLCAPAALPGVRRAAALMPPSLNDGDRLAVRELPEGAML